VATSPTHTGQHPAPATSPRRRVARIVTEVFAPAVLAAAMPLIVAIHATGHLLPGLGWGLLALLFSAIIPYTVIRVGMRRGNITDHHIGVREQRRTPLLLGLASVTLGLALLIALGAPRELLAMVAVMLATVAGIAAVNLRWKLSAHTAVAAGSTTVLTILYGPLLLTTALLVALIGWSRVQLRDHTPTQVTAGAGLGTIIAAAIFLLIR
jgi:membrane-associated phospholipid phosphatase